MDAALELPSALTWVVWCSTVTAPPSAESVLRREKRANSMARAFIGGSAVPDARVEPRIGEVDDEVQRHQGGRDQHDVGLHHRVIPK